MNRRPRVSIVVPVFHGANDLPELFSHLRAQTFQDFELVIADDASHDDSLAVAAHLKSEAGFPVNILAAEKNGGPAAARNRGICAARGDIIAFCDVDDTWHPEKLARQIELFESDPDLTIVGAQGLIRLDDGTAAGLLIPKSVLGSDEPQKALFWDSYLQTSAVAVRRDALDGHGFDESFQIGEDRDLYIRLAMEGKLGLIADSMFEYMRRPGTTMARKAVSRRSDTIRMIELNLRRYGHCLTARERRFARGKAFYDAGEALSDPPHSRFAGLPYLFRAARLGYRPAACLRKGAALLARKSGLKRGGKA